MSLFIITVRSTTVTNLFMSAITGPDDVQSLSSGGSTFTNNSQLLRLASLAVKDLGTVVKRARAESKAGHCYAAIDPPTEIFLRKIV